MPWNRQSAIDRIKRNVDATPAIEVSPLERKMDLENVTLSRPKRIEGAHIYCAIKNEGSQITDHLDVAEQDQAREPARLVHLWQREVTRIVKDFDAAKIHFQGTRLHAIVYRPVGDGSEIAERAMALAAAVGLATRLAFNDVFGESADLEIVAGVSHGETLATRSGSVGDSELLFLGDAANQGAKAISDGAVLRGTKELVDLLDTSDGSPTVTEDPDGFFEIVIGRAKVEEIASNLGVEWSVDRSQDRIVDDAQQIALDDFEVSKATSTIDKNKLGRSNNKLNHAATAFGDVDGFTALVEQKMEEGKEEELIRTFHNLRAELRHVAVQDFDTLRIQYQGDRIQILRHLEHADAGDRALNAVRVAAAWQSSVEDTIPGILPEVAGVHLAIGIGADVTLVSKLGETGNRDVICLGEGVREAGRIEGRLEGDEVGLSKEVHDALPSRVADLFEKSDEKGCFVAQRLRYNDVVLAEEAGELDEGSASADKSVATVGGAGGYRPRHRWAS